VPISSSQLSTRGDLKRCLIGGEWIVPGDAELVVRNPATGGAIAAVAYGDARSATLAADAASNAFRTWSSTSVRARSEILHRVGGLLLDRAQAIGGLLALESGKRVVEAVGEVQFAAQYFRHFAEECRQPRGRVLTEEDANRRHLTRSRPAGVAICLTPWNFPVSIQARKVAPALAAGCTTVARASEKAPLAVIELYRVMEEAGVPPGVVNLIHGPAKEQAEMLLDHPGVRVLSFTGSTAVGSALMRTAARRIVKIALELGGDAPFIVFDDANLDDAINGLMVAKFRNNGQSCIAANRVYVHESVFEEFSSRLGRATAALSVGDPTRTPAVDLGPLIDQERLAAVERLVSEAIEGGAGFVGEAPALPTEGNFTRPGFLRDVPEQSGLANQEVFGPVAPIFSFASEEEVVERANATEMGLAGYAYTADGGRQWRLADSLEVGILGINHPLPSVAFAPMGGMKQSGLGREGASEGIEEFMETSYISLAVH
jgi:succinate-semialdehyde dehydrogenase/glutarate-semialdehyde dehydrogenase